MGFSPFANSSFQMGVTVMGFAEHFEQYHAATTLTSTLNVLVTYLILIIANAVRFLTFDIWILFSKKTCSEQQIRGF